MGARLEKVVFDGVEEVDVLLKLPCLVWPSLITAAVIADEVATGAVVLMWSAPSRPSQTKSKLASQFGQTVVKLWSNWSNCGQPDPFKLPIF